MNLTRRYFDVLNGWKGHTPEVGNSTANRDSYQLYLHEFLTIQIVALKKLTTLFQVGTMN